MTQLYDGRHLCPLPNSKSRCLMENYVEERAVAELNLDKKKMEKGMVTPQQLIKNGNIGLLTQDFCAPIKDLTTNLDAYRPTHPPGPRMKGSRAELMEKMLYEKALRELTEEEKPKPDEPTDFRSLTHVDFFDDDFVPTRLAPTAAHDYKTEMPVSYWTDHRDRIQCVSNVKPTFNTPFRKNTAFSCPTNDLWDPDQALPYEHDHAPNM